MSFDPEALPVLGRDAHLRPARPDELSLEAVRWRFGEPTDRRPGPRPDQPSSGPLPAPAAVLVGLVPRAGGLAVLLTLRAGHLSAHPGQVSFPGGRAELDDADEVATALREAHEEIGLEPAFVDVIGRLPNVITGTGFVVTPVVAELRPGFVLRADPSEVAEVFEVPLAFLMTPAHHQRHAVEIGGSLREFLSMPWEMPTTDGAARRYFIWGATAAMLRDLYVFLTAS